MFQLSGVYCRVYGLGFRVWGGGGGARRGEEGGREVRWFRAYKSKG